MSSISNSQMAAVEKILHENQVSTQVSTVDTQCEMPWFALTEKPESIDNSIVSRVKTINQALKLSIALSRYKLMDKQIALSLGIHASQFSRIINGRDSKGKMWHFPAHLIGDFEVLVGNTLLTQWLAQQRENHFDDDARKLAELREQVAALEAKQVRKAG